MTRTQRRRIESRLQRDRDRAERLLKTAVESLEFDTSTADRADVANIAIEQEAERRVISLESAAVQEIDEALTQLEAHPERYGRCATCGARIAKARLAVLPSTAYCAEHAADS